MVRHLRAQIKKHTTAMCLQYEWDQERIYKRHAIGIAPTNKMLSELHVHDRSYLDCMGFCYVWSVHLNDLKAVGVIGIVIGIIVVYHTYSRID